ncbi:hypothetical protein TNCV_2898561 [Trichonephila clavipes]|nr:hypothetical protein TNCV_2898561 [Trichonephila clavipes]
MNKYRNSTSIKFTDTETLPSNKLTDTEPLHTTELTGRTATPNEMFTNPSTPDNLIGGLFATWNNLPVLELEEENSKIDNNRFHIVPHVTHLSLGNVEEQTDEGTETNSSISLQKKFNGYGTKKQTFCEGKGIVDLTDSEEESSEKISLKRHKE